jgi:hypothetical protein
MPQASIEKLIKEYGIQHQCEKAMDCVINSDLFAMIFTGRGRNAQGKKMNWQGAKDYLIKCLNTYTKTFNPNSGMDITNQHTLDKLCMCNNLLNLIGGSTERFTCNLIRGSDFTIETIQQKLDENCILIGAFDILGFDRVFNHAVAIIGTTQDGKAQMLEPIFLKPFNKEPDSDPQGPPTPWGRLKGMVAKCPENNSNASTKAAPTRIEE